uniref:Sorting nexin N-terminal domain-containing protein n=1 Tax=Naja naja TaxID=35670 RepID=A0A8C6XQ60_NAJNA
MASAGSPVDRLPPPFPVEAEAAEASHSDPQPDSDSDGEDIFTGNAVSPLALLGSWGSLLAWLERGSPEGGVPFATRRPSGGVGDLAQDDGS